MKAKDTMLNSLTGEVIVEKGQYITPRKLFRFWFPEHDIWVYYRKVRIAERKDKRRK